MSHDLFMQMAYSYVYWLFIYLFISIVTHLDFLR